MPLDVTPDAITTASLADATMTALRAFFLRQDHHPSADHFAALEDIARTLEAMADGRCAERVFLSAVDPGVGKTQTVVHFARALVADERRRDVGMVVCVGRITEAVALADAMKLPAGSLAILTADDKANAKGSGVPEC